jgi:hypothetical protein
MQGLPPGVTAMQGLPPGVTPLAGAPPGVTAMQAPPRVSSGAIPGPQQGRSGDRPSAPSKPRSMQSLPQSTPQPLPSMLHHFISLSLSHTHTRAHHTPPRPARLLAAGDLYYAGAAAAADLLTQQQLQQQQFQLQQQLQIQQQQQLQASRSLPPGIVAMAPASALVASEALEGLKKDHEAALNAAKTDLKTAQVRVYFVCVCVRERVCVCVCVMWCILVPHPLISHPPSDPPTSMSFLSHLSPFLSHPSPSYLQPPSLPSSLHPSFRRRPPPSSAS